ncbi:aspartate aminotransferase family protein [candidate division KSB1 bacterium]|nr:aspartate aminotransferase family protein [candidate division KSB1 bacterium]
MSYQSLLESTLAHTLNYIENLENAPVNATAPLPDLRQHLNHPLADDGMDATQVIDELVADVQGGILGTSGGRFFGWVVGGCMPAALAADWLTSTWDQPAALYASGPAIAVIEEVCGQWLKELLGLPQHASFALVTGCSMAHVTCLAAARNALLAKHNWDVERKGLNGAPPIRIMSNNQRHGSIARSVRLLGIGNDNVFDLSVNEQGHLDPEALRNELREHAGKPTIVLLQAGDINTGVFEPFDKLIPIAHDYGAWVHIDGAFGLWAAASPKYKHLLNGVEHANSWAVDGHKWLNVPYDCGYAFITDSRAHQAAMSHRASYLTHDAVARDQMDWTPEWSHRGRGVATYATIRQLGKRGVAELIERTCRYTQQLITGIGTLPGAEVMWEPIINQGLVRFLSSKPDATDADHDQFTDDVIARVVESGEAFFSGTTWQGRRCMRVSVCNWKTNETDVECAINAVQRVLKKR